jgi:hypothetical protein
MEKKSKNGAKEFAELVDKDYKVREEVREAATSILEVAKKHGYNFTGQEMQDYLQTKWKVPKKKPKRGGPYGDEDGDDPMTTWCW